MPACNSLFVPARNNWNQIFPNLEAASKNITNFVRDGQKAGAIGMMNTTWDDDGEALFEMTWHPIALGAAASWQEGAVDIEKFDRDFDWAFFRNDGDQFVKAARALGQCEQHAGNSDQRRILLARSVHHSVSDSGANQRRPHQANAADGRRGARISDAKRKARAAKCFGSRADEVCGAALRSSRPPHQMVQKFSDEYWDAYLNLGDRAKARKLRYYHGAIYNNMREMAEELAILKEGYRRQWLAENRPYWLESVLARYDQMISIWLAKSRAHGRGDAKVSSDFDAA